MLEWLRAYAVALALPCIVWLLFTTFRRRYLQDIRRAIYSPAGTETPDFAPPRARPGAPLLTVNWIDAAGEASTPLPRCLAEAHGETQRLRTTFALAGGAYVLAAAAFVWHGARAADARPHAAVALAYFSTIVGVVLIVAFVGRHWSSWLVAGAGWLALPVVLMVGPLQMKLPAAVMTIAYGLQYASLPFACVVPLALRTIRPLVTGFVPLVGLWLVGATAVEFLLHSLGLSFEGHFTAPAVVLGGVAAAAGVTIAAWHIRRGVTRRFVLTLAALAILGLPWSLYLPFDFVGGVIGGTAMNGLQTLVVWALFSRFLRLKGQGYLTDEILHFSLCWLVLTAFLPMLAQVGWASVPFAVLTFLAYVTALILLLRRNARLREPQSCRRLLLLRVFDQEAVRRRLLDLLDDSWRWVGRLDLIVGPDLAVRSLGAGALSGFLLGRVHRHLLATVEQAARRITSLPVTRAVDGRYPLNEFHCAPNVWPHVVSALATGVDVVLLDLRGWRTTHRGATFELALVLERVPLSRIVVLTDQHSAEPLLRSAVERAWSGLSAGSVNASLLQPQLGIVRCCGNRSTDAVAIAHRVFLAAVVRPGASAGLPTS